MVVAAAVAHGLTRAERLGEVGIMAREPEIMLAPGAVYFADNGFLICLKCAGMSAKYTGRDVRGQKVYRMKDQDAADWKRAFGRDLACESGCTVVRL
jgi:hypothetical protein